METNVAVPQSGTNGNDVPKVKRKRPRKWGSLPTPAFTLQMLRSAKAGESIAEFAESVATEVADPPVDISTLSSAEQTEFRNKCAAKVSNIRRMLTGKLPHKRGGGELDDEERDAFLNASQNLRNALFSLNGENVPPIDGKRIPRLKGSSAGRTIHASVDEVNQLRALLGF